MEADHFNVSEARSDSDGILETRREGTRAYVKADTRSPIFPELRSHRQDLGVVPTLQTILRPLDRLIGCAVVYGSVARREEHAASQIDLLVVGGLADLTPGLRKAEPRLGREVNVTSYSAAKCRKNAAAEGLLAGGSPAGPKAIREGRPA